VATAVNHVLDGRTLINRGTATWDAGTIFTPGGGVFDNLATFVDRHPTRIPIVVVLLSRVMIGDRRIGWRVEWGE